METRILETMSACHDNSKQLVVMQGQLNTLQTTMQAIAEQMNQITNYFATSAGQQGDGDQNGPRSPVKKKLRKGSMNSTRTNSEHSQPDTESDNRTHQRDSEPRQTEQIINIRDSDDANQSADLEEAQYTQPSSPGTAMDE